VIRKHHSRLAAVTLAGAVAALLVAGCSSSGAKTNASTQSTGSSGSSSGKHHSIVFISGALDVPFYIGMQCAMQREATKLGDSFSVVGATNFDASLQIPIVTSVGAKRPSGGIIAPTDATALIAPLRSLSQEGVKLAQVDTAISDTSFVSSSLTSDNVGAGENLAKMFVSLTKVKSGPILLLDNAPGSSSVYARGNGVVQEMKNYPQYSVIREFDHNQASNDATIMAATLSAHPNLAGVISTYSPSIEGALPALRSAGKLGKMTLVSFDSDPTEVKLLQQNVLQGVMTQQIDRMGTEAVQNLDTALNGGTPPKSVAIPMVEITSKNVNSAASRSLYYPAKYDPNTCS
jgi:ribose transport system substrate-binding protein